jgi:hypothetical protein
MIYCAATNSTQESTIITNTTSDHPPSLATSTTSVMTTGAKIETSIIFSLINIPVVCGGKRFYV